MTAAAAVGSAYFIDVYRFFQDAYSNSFCAQFPGVESDTSRRRVSYKYLHSLYDIHERFYMDTEYAAMRNREACQEALGRAALKKLKRLRKKKRNDAKAASLKDLAVRQLLLSSLEEVNKSITISAAHPPRDPLVARCDGNNELARTASKITGPGDTLRELAMSAVCRSKERYFINDDCIRRGIDDGRLFGCIVNVSLSAPTCVCALGATYVLPACCTFLMSGPDGLELLADEQEPYDFIVIDPPWQNKSVRRKDTYNSLPVEDLATLPVGRLAGDNCLVACWVTNASRHVASVRDTLFESWNLTFVGEWHWLKVTTQGETIHDITSAHQKPYETLCIGRRRVSQQANLEKRSTSDEKQSAPPLPRHRTVISVPCALHSSKPPLIDVFRPFLPQTPRCLELFARNLLPGFTSWGNESALRKEVDNVPEPGSSGVRSHQHTTIYLLLTRPLCDPGSVCLLLPPLPLLLLLLQPERRTAECAARGGGSNTVSLWQ